MIPFYISGCFSVLHPAAGRRGVLICGPLSDEALNVYRPLVFLGEKLAHAGIPTLRMAYYGTGDSLGEDDEPDRFNRWLDDIAAGVAWLRSHGDIDSVTLVGHRVGAMLAARAACDIDAVDSLVLLAPASGRQFLHELTLSARISQRVWQTSHKADDGTWFESHGLRIDRGTRDALNALDARQLPSRPAARALLLEAEERASTKAISAALTRLGTDATVETFNDIASMLRDSHRAEVPGRAFDRIVDWTRALGGCTDGAGAADAAADAATDAVADPAADTTVGTGAGQELPLTFGTPAGLFGILSLPKWQAPDRPAILLVNTSANPRWGNGRIAVQIARSLAGDGIATLRMDASGIGDAAPETGAVGRPYSAAITQEVLQAAKALAARADRPVVVLGMCSGAYHAFWAACQGSDICGLILVNLQRFVWRESDPPDQVRRSDLRPTRFYLRQVFGWQAWLRLLRADFDVANLVRVLALRMLRRGIAGLDPVLSRVLPGKTRVGRVRHAMHALERRQVEMLYVLGYNDPGVEELAEYFGANGWRLRDMRNATITLLEDADHTFGAAKLRAALIAEIRAWCRDSWPVGDEVDRRRPVEPAGGSGAALRLPRTRRREVHPVGG
jgi:pimeloyl-ACP methyl ester carboxylesterase